MYVNGLYFNFARWNCFKLCGVLWHAILAPEPQWHAPNNFFARAAGRYVLTRVRDGTRESDTHTYLTNASLGP